MAENFRLYVKKGGNIVEDFESEGFYFKAMADDTIFGGSDETKIINNENVSYTGKTDDITMDIIPFNCTVEEICVSNGSGNNTAKAIIIGNKVKKISNNAFKDFSTLSSLTIGKNITEIGSGIIDGCSSLKRIVCLASTPPTLNENALSGLPSDAKIYVQEDYLETYKNSAVWNNYIQQITHIATIYTISKISVGNEAQSYSVDFTTSGTVNNLTITPEVGTVTNGNVDATYSGVTKSYFVYDLNVNEELLSGGSYKVFYEDANGNKLDNFEEITEFTVAEGDPWASVTYNLGSKTLTFTVQALTDSSITERSVHFLIKVNNDAGTIKEVILVQKNTQYVENWIIDAELSKD